jgi:hypothetical protein
MFEMLTRLLAVLSLAAALGAAAQAQTDGEREPLNSERIEARFGSYGIEVLASDERLRVSNLFSTHDGERVTRTFAVVRYPTRVDPAFAAEHAAVLAGGSIGATFVAGGWDVVKTHRYFGEVESTARLRGLMATDAARLAVHVYELDIVKDEEGRRRRFTYATISEVHHPEYLRLDDVVEIYAPGWLGGGGADVNAMLATVRERIAEEP